jgi:hypothetical protein
MAAGFVHQTVSFIQMMAYTALIAAKAQVSLLNDFCFAMAPSTPLTLLYRIR